MIALPAAFTRPCRSCRPTVSEIWSPFSLPAVIGCAVQVAGHFWKVLRQRQVALRRLPRALHLRRHDPQKRRAPARAVVGHRLRLVGVPVFHRERVRHDARARLQVEDRRPQLHVDARQQEHRDDGRLAQVGLEQVGLHERRFGGHPFFLRRSASTTRPCRGCIRCPSPWRRAWRR